MDRRTAADGNGRIFESLVISTSEGGQTHHMTISRTDPFIYDPFGSTLAQYGSLASANSYRFSSKEWNANSGLYYYLYRFYDPNLQRWLNQDPLMDFGSTTFDQMPKRSSFNVFRKEQREPNAYEFVDNDPIAVFDLFGLQSWMGPGYGAFGPGGVNGSGGGGCPCSPGQQPQYQKEGITREQCIQNRQNQLPWLYNGVNDIFAVLGVHLVEPLEECPFRRVEKPVAEWPEWQWETVLVMH
jgi:RHS repeat-associated protein